jgi:hypothetical protein
MAERYSFPLEAQGGHNEEGAARRVVFHRLEGKNTKDPRGSLWAPKVARQGIVVQLARFELVTRWALPLCRSSSVGNSCFLGLCHMAGTYLGSLIVDYHESSSGSQCS